MKVFIIDNSDSKCVVYGTEAFDAIKNEMEYCEPGDEFTVICKEMTQEEIDALLEL